MIKTLKEDCFGCTACSAICDFAAISMEKDVEGFVYPIGDQDKCTDCDLCNKVCPAQSESFAKNNTVSPDCFAGWCRDEKIRKESSSGGVFTLLAEYVLDNNGFVCGASFDEDNRLKQVIIDDKKELPKLRGSKYIQCEMGDVFLRIKELLDENKVVLYVGTPCQVAGLHGFLRKDYDTLLSVDLLCHGTPSQKIFDRYMEEVGEGKDEISGISFRDKTTGWSNFSFCFSFDYKKNNVQSKYLRQFRNTRYMVGLTKNLTLRPCCTSCAFATLPRVSDITLGDFWGIDSYDKNLDDDGGTSMILVNNSKGRKLLEKIKPEMATCQAVPLEVAVKRSPILRMPAVVHKNRGSFFKKVGDRSSVINLIERELGRNRVGIMNFHSSNHDFGAVMVAYALSRSVERLGYKPEIVNFVPKRFKGDNSVFDDFRRKFLKRTKLCKSVAELRKLNRFFDKFVVGSGQVWRWHSDYRYFFNWVLGNKSIISYAASFGSDRFVGSEVEKGRIRELLSRFESVSVGEKTAVDICDDTFNVSAEQVLDPTLLLSAQDYEEIISSYDVKEPEKKYVAYMFLDDDPRKVKDEIKNIEKLKSEYEFINVLKNEEGDSNSVGQWLSLIKNAEYFITDSFHGCIFAIIFRKQFVCIKRDIGGNIRIESLFNTLGIEENRFHENLNDVTEKSFQSKIDYESVYNKLEANKVTSLGFLKRSLSIEPSLKNYVLDDGASTIRLFNWLPIVKIECSVRYDEVRVMLFGFIYLLKIKRSRDSLKLYLFGKWPVLTL